MDLFSFYLPTYLPTYDHHHYYHHRYYLLNISSVPGFVLSAEHYLHKSFQ